MSDVYDQAPPAPFDTPDVIPTRKGSAKPQKAAGKRTARERLTDARDVLGHGLDAAGKPFVKPATVWKEADAKRSAARTEENLNTLREAHREQRDALRDLRRDRKAFEKARDEVEWWNVFNGERRAARAVVRDTRAIVTEKRAARREAQKAYPDSLGRAAVKVHLAHGVPTFLWSALTDSFLADVAATGSIAAVALNAATVFLGGRLVAGPATDVALEALQPSQEERDLLQRLDPKAWPRYAEPRGLEDVVPAGATLTDSGIQAKLTLNGTMDLDKLKKATSHLRAALRLKEGTRLELREGKTGGHARLTIRTRSKTDGLDLMGWKPGDCWAVDSVTGETIPVPLGKRILVAGQSGSGKSTSLRPLMAEASETEDNRLVIFDRKFVEARTWAHRARVACELQEMYDLSEELEEEGNERLKALPRGKDSVDISASCPRITVFVDEGGELLQDCARKEKILVGHDDDGKPIMDELDYNQIIDRLRTIGRKFRAAEIILVWATQKPTYSGKGAGLDSQIAGNLNMKLCLNVASDVESRTVFGNTAVDNGFRPHELPMPWYGLLYNAEKGVSGQSTNAFRMRWMKAEQVIDLPARWVWKRGSSADNQMAAGRRVDQEGSNDGATVTELPAVQLVKDAAPAPVVTDPWAAVTSDGGAAPAVDADTIPLVPKARVSAADRDDQILAELVADPCQSLSELARRVGASKSVVKKRLDQMSVDGLVRVDDDDCWYPVD